ncbi:MAG: STAS domain-containing protein [Terracidiphilus sp.]|jgi:anti-anti-sigma factor
MSIAICDHPVSGFIATAESASHSEFILTDLVRENDGRLLDRLMPLVRSQSLALDLSAVQRIDADGITALIFLYRSARQAGHRFTVSNASPRVEKTLALVGLDRILLSHNVTIHSQSRP